MTLYDKIKDEVSNYYEAEKEELMLRITKHLNEFGISEIYEKVKKEAITKSLEKHYSDGLNGPEDHTTTEKSCETCKFNGIRHCADIEHDCVCENCYHFDKWQPKDSSGEGEG